MIENIVNISIIQENIKLLHIALCNLKYRVPKNISVVLHSGPNCDKLQVCLRCVTFLLPPGIKRLSDQIFCT